MRGRIGVAGSPRAWAAWPSDPHVHVAGGYGVVALAACGRPVQGAETPQVAADLVHQPGKALEVAPLGLSGGGSQDHRPGRRGRCLAAGGGALAFGLPRALRRGVLLRRGREARRRARALLRPRRPGPVAGPVGARRRGSSVDPHRASPNGISLMHKVLSSRAARAAAPRGPAAPHEEHTMRPRRGPMVGRAGPGGRGGRKNILAERVLHDRRGFLKYAVSYKLGHMMLMAARRGQMPPRSGRGRFGYR
jgi:hypothetical protein